ncbi:MAG: NUDIX domain-containing protein [Patescibacteria group bacterium]
MAKRTSVGLVVITNLPGMGTVAVLQRRGIWNFEKGKLESWPGGCQVTAHGGVEEGEDPLRTLQREVGEELGDAMRSVLFEDDPKLRPLIEVDRHEGEKEDVITYAVKVEPDVFKKYVRLSPDSGGLSFVAPEGVADIQDLRTFDKAIGVTDLRTIAMFEDEKRAVATAFSHFGV